MSMYYPPKRSDEIYHWGIEKGKESKNHKYFNRILLGSKNGQNLYRYFYDKASWFAYNNNKQQTQPARPLVSQQNALSDKASSNNRPSILERVLFGAVGSELVRRGKEALSNVLNPDIKVEHDVQVNEETQEERDRKWQEYQEEQRKREEEARKKLEENNLKKIEEWNNAADKNGGKKIEDLTSEEEAHRYVGKVLMPDGTYRYFYTQSELQAFYSEVGDPAAKEYAIKDRTMTEEEDMAEINEKYNQGVEYQNNCYSCTIAYDMRRRGYDVEAIPDPDGDFFLDYRQAYINPKTKSYTENMDADTMAKTLISDLKAEGEGARGNLGVQWLPQFGGGHSMAWEVQNGKVIIRDNQTNEIITEDKIPALMSYTNCASNSEYNVMVNFYYPQYNEPFGAINWYRCDNCEVDFDKMKKYIKFN